MQAVSDGGTTYDFGEKYTKTNMATRFFLDGFFASAAKLLGQLRCGSALEVGCGEGFSTARLRRMLPAPTHFEASDVETRLVEAARRRNPEVRVSQESIYELQRQDNAFDLVICMEVLEHLTEPARALEELARVSNGWLLLSVPREPIWRVLNMARLRYVTALGNTPGHLQHWSGAGFVQFVQRVATPMAVRRPLPWTQVLARVHS